MYDPKNIRPRDGWVVVLAEPRKTVMESGLLLAPNETGAEKVTEGAGLLIRVGPGKKNTQLGLEAGLRIVFRGFLRWANPIETEEKWEDGKNKQYFIMSAEDILCVIPDGVEVGVYSGRPQNPELKGK
jgi:co-chaperonin GroES (HSP10)